jgi:chemotaxis protein MotB
MALQERDDLAAKNAALKKDVDTATSRGNALEQEKTALEGNVSAQQQRIQEMEAQTRGLGAALEREKEEAQRLKATYDGLVGQLKGELAAGQVEIQQLKSGLSVNLAHDILFASGSAELDKDGREVLLKVSDQLKTTPYQIVIMGHTDNVKIGPGLVGRFPTNWELGSARAARIVRLFQESGIPGERLAAVSFADNRPRVANDSPEGRAKNRRIEIRLRPAVPEDEEDVSARG